MKKILTIAMVILLLASCKPAIEVEKIVYRERAIPVQVPEDSTRIKALIECDSNNRAVLRSFDQYRSKYVISSFVSTPLPDNSLELVYEAVTAHPDTVIIVNDSLVERIVKGDPYPVEVERQLSWLQKTLMYTGAAALLILLIYILFKIFNPFKFLQK